MSDTSYDLTREAHRGYPAGQTVLAGGAIVTQEPPALDTFGPSRIVVDEHGTTIVPASSTPRAVHVYNEGYCAVRLGGAAPGGLTFAAGGYLLRARETWAGHIRGEMRAITPAGSMGALAVSIGT